MYNAMQCAIVTVGIRSGGGSRGGGGGGGDRIGGGGGPFIPAMNGVGMLDSHRDLIELHVQTAALVTHGFLFHFLIHFIKLNNNNLV